MLRYADVHAASMKSCRDSIFAVGVMISVREAAKLFQQIYVVEIVS